MANFDGYSIHRLTDALPLARDGPGGEKKPHGLEALDSAEVTLKTQYVGFQSS